MTFFIRLTCAVFAAFIYLFPQPAFADYENIQLQLKWLHQFQFAGFYMAQEKGYYRDAGLGVEIIEGAPDNDPIDFVVRSDARYAISNSGALIAHSQGQPIHAIAVIFQHSPLALMVKEDSGIQTISDLKNKRIMMQNNYLNAEIMATLNKFGLDKSSFTFQPTSYNLNDLIDDLTDAFSIYVTDQPHQLKLLGIPYRIFYPRNNGVDFYGDVLITSTNELENHPKRVEAMRQASLKGWSYALENIDETIDVILEKYNSQNLSRQQLSFEAQETKKVAAENLVEIGFMNDTRWQHIAEVYVEQNMLPENYDFSGFLYRNEPSLNDYLQQYLWQVIVFSILLILLALALHGLVLRRTLKRRTAELQLSETRLSDIIEVSNEWIWEVDTEGRYTYSSRMVEKILGYTSDDILNTHFFDYFVPDQRETLKKEIFESFARQQSFTQLINANIHKDGHQLVLLSDGVPLFDDGKVIGYRGSNRDVTSQHRAEKLSLKTSAILEMIASGKDTQDIYDAIILMYEARNPSMRGSILLIQGSQLFHCSSPSLPKAYSNAIDGVEIGPSVGSCGTAAFNKERTIVEDIATDPLWETFKGVALAHGLQACWSEPILDAQGDVYGTFAMYYGAPRKPTEAELADISGAAWLVGIVIENVLKNASLSKLSQAISQVGDAVMITDLQGKIEYVNEEFSKVTGYSETEAIGQTPNILKSDKHTKAFFQAMWRSAVDDGQWNGTVWNKRKNGELYPESLRIRKLTVDEETPSRYIATFSDITERMTMEDALRNAQKMEALGTLVGGVAHNFNNILAGIVGKSYLAQLKIADEESMCYLKDIDGLCKRSSQMVQHLLMFARKGHMEMQDLALIPLLKESIQTARLSVSESVEFNEQLSDEQLYIHGDASQLQQVIMNLINNASQSVEDSPNKIISIRASRCTSAEYTPDNSCEDQGNGIACIVVEDTGSGIHDDDLEHIFEPFFTTKEVGVGTGLGLSMTHGTIKSHGGSIDVESELSKGTTFKICLPLIDRVPVKQATHIQCIAPAMDTLILLVDDDAVIRETLAEILLNMDYQVMTANDGAAAVALFKSKADSIDLVLIDYAMPVMDGLEAIALMRQINAQLPVLLSTGYDKGHVDIETFNADITKVISKPVSIPELSHHIEMLISISKSN